MDLKSLARDLFLKSLRSLPIDSEMQKQVSASKDLLTIGANSFELSGFDEIVLIAVGKAGGPMLDSILRLLAPARDGRLIMRSLLVAPDVNVRARPDVETFNGAHPFPTNASRMAACAALRLLETATCRSLVLFLLSGGASSMIEEPLDQTLSTAEMKDFYRGLVHSGLPIEKMNALRKHASRIKGGRLAVAAGDATQCTVIVSDVPGDLLHLVGSGPSLPDPFTVSDCHRILEEHGKSLAIPERMRRILQDHTLPETPKPDHPAFRQSTYHVLLSNRELVEQARKAAAERGYFVEIDNACDDWDYRDAAQYLLTRLKRLRQDHERVCLLSGGELSVKVSPVPGVGGRNQQFVLECARLLPDLNVCATVLSAGSDGVDGNSDAAGAVADETTFSRAQKLGLRPQEALEMFNTYPIFSALQDAVMTGPTGNNLRDLRILLSRATI